MAHGQRPNTNVEEAIARVAPRVTDLRHDIHQNPELSNREFRTAELIVAHLRGLGIEVRTGIANTGVVGVLKGTRPGPIVAVRADMDALPVTEETPYAFRSTVRTTYNPRRTKWWKQLRLVSLPAVEKSLSAEPRCGYSLRVFGFVGGSTDRVRLGSVSVYKLRILSLNPFLPGCLRL